MPGAVSNTGYITKKWLGVHAGDRQMAMNRFAAGVIVLSFNLWAKPRGLVSGLPLVGPAIFIVAGWLIALYLMARPASSVRRRVIALIVDCGAVSYELHIGGAATCWLFAGYLWTISGNGYRFGSRFQIYAMAIASIGFCAMAAVTPYWSGQPALVFGVLINLTVVPLYALALIKRLSQATHQAEEASRAKSLFIASVSHELRTPLNAVIGMGSLLESSDLKPDQVQMSQTITTAARSLLSLIDGILDLSRAEAGRMPIAHTDFDLLQVLNELKTIFVAQGRVKGVQLNLHVTARTPLLLHGDARKLHEILLNLIGNGMKFTATGSITVGVDAVTRQDAQVRLRFEVIDTGIGIAPEAHQRIFEVFTQADEAVVNRFGGTGLGLALVRKSVEFLGGEIGVESAPGAGSTFWFELPMLAQAEILEEPNRFNHLRALVLARRPGVVAPLIGRLIESGVKVEHVAARHPGWPDLADPSSACLLAFISTPPDAPQRQFDALTVGETPSFIDIREGTATGLPDTAAQRSYASILYMPVTDGELNNVLQFVSSLPGHGNNAPKEEVRQQPAPRESFNVLVADDNATNRYVLDMILRSAGHAVTLVGDGEEALDALAEHAFDAAIMDVNMPVMGGIEATKIYRMTAMGTTAIPLIALTADASATTRQLCLDAGMAACLVKPVEPARLIAMINEVVGKARKALPQSDMPPDPRVTEIAAHPRFRGNLPPAIEPEVLAGLRGLGGDTFVIEVTDTFRGEARTTLLELRAAASQGDVSGFRAHVHALRSVAANIGARHLCEVCLPFQSISAAELRQNSPVWLEQIEAELSRVETALTDYRSDCAAHTNR